MMWRLNRETSDTERRITSVVLVIGVALVAALVVRHSRSRGELRMLASVAGVALAARLVAVGVIYAIATRVHAEGTWLNDEASYFLSTEALMPWPWDRALPRGLDHLSGNGYLGLTSAVSLLVGSVNTTALRLTNASIGTVVALLCAVTATALFGRKAGLVAGLGAALWPDLILWSATFVRDMLGSLVVIGVWWALTAGRRQPILAVCMAFLAVVLAGTLREYLAVAVGLGLIAWFAHPLIRRQSMRTLVAASVGVLAVAVVAAVFDVQRIDAATHELFYRQTVTRMETLGRLYRDPPPLDQPMQLPFRPGTAIAIPDPTTGWLSAGLVEDSSEPGVVSVSLTDNTERTVPLSEVVLLQDARIPPVQLLSWTLPSMISVFAGIPEPGDELNLGWVAAALAWDALLVLAMFGVRRAQLPLREWLFPVCVIVVTLAVLSAVPGAPGNAERHRATQTVPLLLVLASGLVASRARSSAPEGRAAISATSMPTRATTAIASVRRSDL